MDQTSIETSRPVIGGRWAQQGIVSVENGVASWLASDGQAPHEPAVILKVPVPGNKLGHAILAHQIQVMRGFDWNVAASVIERPLDMAGADDETPYIVERRLEAVDGWHPCLELLVCGAMGVHSPLFLSLLRKVLEARLALRSIGIVVRHVTPLTLYTKTVGDTVAAIRLTDLRYACSPVDESRWRNLVVGHVYSSAEALAGVVTYGGDDFAFALLLFCAAYGLGPFETYERRMQQALSSMQVSAALVAVGGAGTHGTRRRADAARRLAALQRTAGDIDVALKPLFRRLRLDGLADPARKMLGAWPWHRGPAFEELYRTLRMRAAAGHCRSVGAPLDLAA